MRAHSLETRKRAIARVLAGEKREDVAASMGIAYPTICNWVREAHIRAAVAEERAQAVHDPEPDSGDDEARQDDDLPAVPQSPIVKTVHTRFHTADQEERDYALAILSELEVDISPEMLRILLNAAKRVLLKGGLHDT